MRLLDMAVHGRKASHIRAWSSWVRGFLALLVGVVLIAVPTTAWGSPPTSRAQRAPSTSSQLASAVPAICRPEPPDYPGCSPTQVRPLLRALFAAEYTGHESGYRYYRMGQHHRGVIFAHLPPALNAKLAKLYAEAVARFSKTHTTQVVDAAGIVHTVPATPAYPTWAGFRANATAMCNGDVVTSHFPTQYCWSITKVGQAGAVIRDLLNKTLRMFLSCDGYAVGGWATGSYAAWRLGTGILAGGYYGAVGVEIGCQTTNLWNWATNLW